MVTPGSNKTNANADVEENPDSTAQEASSSQVSCESYPISQPLAAILRRVIQSDDSSSTNTSNMNGNVEIVRESVEDALQNVIRNCFTAMDEMYFYT
jgi:hypothetical protein